jgi:hypothetical protein
VLRGYEALQEQGQSATPEELCRDCPELLPEVQRRLDLLRTLPAPPGDSTKPDPPPLYHEQPPPPLQATVPQTASEATRCRETPPENRGHEVKKRETMNRAMN